MFSFEGDVSKSTSLLLHESRPEETANAVLRLCSDAASYITGQSISVDGG